ncbi:MAG: hypothetical protein ACP5TK_00495 [Candidatus Micrarchaeia archaeon]
MLEVRKEKSSKELSIAEKYKMFRGLFSTKIFKNEVRPILYQHFQDVETVHENTLRLLGENAKALRYASKLMGRKKSIEITVKGKRFAPFGTAAGLDKDGIAMLPLSYFFGFLEPGTVLVNSREGNPKPRLMADEANLNVYNAEGFPSKGLRFFQERIIEYRKKGGSAPIYVSVCGLPDPEEGAERALNEMETLISSLGRYADGFVWNPASPNTSLLTQLRNNDMFAKTAELMNRYAKEKLKMVKIWPYEEADKENTISLVRSFIENGGDGVVVVNTKKVGRENINTESWGYESAGISGKALREYRLRAVKDMRSEFPEAMIIACGGIYDGDDAYETFKAGANMLEGFTPYVYFGFGLLSEIEKRVSQRLKADGTDMQTLQKTVLEKYG